MTLSIIYARISSPTQSKVDNTFVSIENQISKCKEYCSLNNLPIKDVISECISARDMYKQKKLVNTINTNDNINIIFYNVTRFSRNIQDAIDLYKICVTKNIKLHFIQDYIITNTPVDIHRLRISLSQAELESDTTSNRVRAVNTVLKEKGCVFGRTPYGSKSTDILGIRKFIMDEYEQNIIKLIICMREKKGTQYISYLKKLLPKNKKIHYLKAEHKKRTFDQIAYFLDNNSIKNRKKLWTSQSVRRIYIKFSNINNVETLFNTLSC